MCQQKSQDSSCVGFDVPDLRDQAEKLARANIEADPGIQQILWFPSETEIRLIEIDPDIPPSGQIDPFYFQPDRSVGIDYTAAIAVIRPEEKNNLKPPEDWGAWNEAEELWPR